jgi:phytanoyl-CoA hydroxylase
MSTATLDIQVTDLQRRQLDEQGFFVTDVLFDDATLDGVRNEFQRLWDENVAHAIKGGDPLTIELAKTRPFLPQLDRQSEACNAFCRHPVMQTISRQLVGPDVDQTWNQAIIKSPLPQGDNSFAWHQDPGYAQNGHYASDSNPDILKHPTNGITVWAAITRTTVDNGTLWVLPGRHMEGLLPHVYSQARREWQGQFDTSWKVPAVMRAGQMLVFRKYLPHGSGPNVSSENRMAYQIGYTVPGLKLGPSPDLKPFLRGGELVPGS